MMANYPIEEEQEFEIQIPIAKQEFGKSIIDTSHIDTKEQFTKEIEDAREIFAKQVGMDIEEKS